MQNVMGTRESAQTLGVSVRTIQLWVEKGLLKAWKTEGGHRRISRDSVTQLLETRERGEKLPSFGHALQVLVVEDDPTMQAYYKALLEILRPDAKLILADNGYQGLIALGQTAPDLMLLDVDMPEMDGIKMLRGVENLQLPENLKIAVVTGLSQAEINARGGLPANVPLFSKPLSVDNLQNILKGIEADSRVQKP